MEQKEPKIKDILICDDIRTESSGKLIYIGIYPEGNINILGKMPYTFPKLCFIIKFEGGFGEYEIEAFLRNPQNKLHLVLPAGRIRFEQDKKEHLVFLSISSLKVDIAGEYTLELYNQKGKKLLFSYNFPISHLEK